MSEAAIIALASFGASMCGAFAIVVPALVAGWVKVQQIREEAAASVAALEKKHAETVKDIAVGAAEHSANATAITEVKAAVNSLKERTGPAEVILAVVPPSEQK